jgi:hypothetical protein
MPSAQRDGGEFRSPVPVSARRGQALISPGRVFHCREHDVDAAIAASKVAAVVEHRLHRKIHAESVCLELHIQFEMDASTTIAPIMCGASGALSRFWPAMM